MKNTLAIQVASLFLDHATCGTPEFDELRATHLVMAEDGSMAEFTLADEDGTTVTVTVHQTRSA